MVCWGSYCCRRCCYSRCRSGIFTAWDYGVTEEGPEKAPDPPKTVDVISKAKSLTVIAALMGIGFSSGVMIGSVREKLTSFNERFGIFDTRISLIESQFSSQSRRLNSHEVRIGVLEKLEQREADDGG